MTEPRKISPSAFIFWLGAYAWVLAGFIVLAWLIWTLFDWIVPSPLAGCL